MNRKALIKIAGIYYFGDRQHEQAARGLAGNARVAENFGKPARPMAPAYTSAARTPVPPRKKPSTVPPDWRTMKAPSTPGRRITLSPTAMRKMSAETNGVSWSEDRERSSVFRDGLREYEETHKKPNNAKVMYAGSGLLNFGAGAADLLGYGAGAMGVAASAPGMMGRAAARGLWSLAGGRPEDIPSGPGIAQTFNGARAPFSWASGKMRAGAKALEDVGNRNMSDWDAEAIAAARNGDFSLYDRAARAHLSNGVIKSTFETAPWFLIPFGKAKDAARAMKVAPGAIRAGSMATNGGLLGFAVGPGLSEGSRRAKDLKAKCDMERVYNMYGAKGVDQYIEKANEIDPSFLGDVGMRYADELKARGRPGAAPAR